MSEQDEVKYNITMQEHIEPDYRDGFADGYSRAWQECWEFMRSIASECTVKPDDTKTEDKP